MKTSFDTDAILFGLLNNNTSIKGAVYVGDDRPVNSLDEDIVVNTIDLAQDYLPQIGTSNINIYAADKTKKIKGNTQLSAQRDRLDALTQEVLAIVRNARIEGVKPIVGNMSVMTEPETKQHFVNIRIDWNIQK